MKSRICIDFKNQVP